MDQSKKQHVQSIAPGASQELMALFEKARAIGAQETDLRYLHHQIGEDLNTPFVVIPNDCVVQDLRHLVSPPQKAAHRFDEVDSFVDFVKYYKTGRTRLYCIESDGLFQAVVDDHSNSSTQPSARAFTGNLTLAKTPEWKSWSDNIGKGLDQMQFALFLEDNGRYVIEPSAADFLQVALTLEAKKGVNFKSGLRLDNGDHKLLFEEDTRTTAGVKGEMEIPHDFKIKLRLYHGGDLVELEGKLRYRIQGGQIVFFYKFPSLENIVREYVSGIREKIRKATTLPVWSVSALYS